MTNNAAQLLIVFGTDLKEKKNQYLQSNLKIESFRQRLNYAYKLMVGSMQLKSRPHQKHVSSGWDTLHTATFLLSLIHHLILIMTSFATLMPFRVNDLPCGLMGSLYGSSHGLTHIQSQWTSDQSYPEVPTLLRPLLPESETFGELDNNHTESIHQQPGSISRPHPNCNTVCPIVLEHAYHYHFLYYLFTFTVMV